MRDYAGRSRQRTLPAILPLSLLATLSLTACLADDMAIGADGGRDDGSDGDIDGGSDADVLTTTFTDGSGQQCSYGGQVYSLGAMFKASDGCNDCTCLASGVACTDMACTSRTCRYEGNIYVQGTTFPSRDGCNTCSCGSGGSVSCTKRACPGCQYEGIHYQAGESFFDGCNTCSCEANGQVICTERACPCGVDGSYDHGALGGLVAWTARTTLPGGRKYKYERTYFRDQPPVTPSCVPDLPECGDAAITPNQIMPAIHHKDVQQALAANSVSPILFGRDTRPVDGTVWEFRRASDGRSFLVGQACQGAPNCVPPPPGIIHLRDLLEKLDQQQLATAECQAAIPKN